MEKARNFLDSKEFRAFFFLCFFLAGIYDNLGCVVTFAMNVKFPKEDLL